MSLFDVDQFFEFVLSGLLDGAGLGYLRHCCKWLRASDLRAFLYLHWDRLFGGLLGVVGGCFLSIGVGHFVGEFWIWLIIITNRHHYEVNIRIAGQILTS